MKVVLFCGGLGTRLREASDVDPKPLVNVGPKPIVWHLMQYYAAYGHTEFVLCLGFRGQSVRDWFLNYDRSGADELVLDGRRGIVSPKETDIADWRITFVETGLHSNIAERLVRVRHLVRDEPMFLANYSDVLTDLPLDRFVDDFQTSGATAGFVSVRPGYSSHGVVADADGRVRSMARSDDMDFWINGGFMTLRPDVFDEIRPGEELVEEPFARLADAGRLWTQRHAGFWRPMDTFKDKSELDRMWNAEQRPWLVRPDEAPGTASGAAPSGSR